MIRLNSDGTMDTTFGSDGKAVAVMASGGVFSSEMTLDSLGRITLVGRAMGYYDSDVAIARFTASGSLDTSFNSTGLTPGTLLIDFGGTDWAEGAALDADGKLVITGTKQPTSGWINNYDVILARVNTDGSLDTTFGNNGKVQWDSVESGDFGADLAILPDGKIMVAAAVHKPLGSEGWRYWAALICFNANGSPDATYGFSGPNGSGTPGGGASYTDDINSPDCITSLTLQSDGKLVLTGFYYASPVRQFIVTRHNAVGTYDTSFSGDGKLAVNYGTLEGIGIQAATVVDGRIVAVGYKDAGTGYGEDFALVVIESGDRLEERLWATHDANWNITAVTDVMGNAAERYEYDPYGTRTVETPTWGAVTGNVSSYNMVNGHQGLRIDTITGWWDGRNRWLIPSLQTWNRADPLGYVDGGDVYQYVTSNPIARVDPMGYWSHVARDPNKNWATVCSNGDSDSWESLGEGVFLDPSEHERWIKDGTALKGNRPQKGKQYEVPNTVYLSVTTQQDAVRDWAVGFMGELAHGFNASRLHVEYREVPTDVMKAADAWIWIAAGHGKYTYNQGEPPENARPTGTIRLRLSEIAAQSKDWTAWDLRATQRLEGHRLSLVWIIACGSAAGPWEELVSPYPYGGQARVYESKVTVSENAFADWLKGNLGNFITRINAPNGPYQQDSDGLWK